MHVRGQRRKSRLLPTVACALALAWPLSTRAQTQTETTEAPVEPSDEAAPTGSESCSVGVPDRGRLRHPTLLEATPHLLIREARRRAQFGTSELVGLIRRAAERVGHAHPGPKLVVGDLSAERGGRLHPHRSHRTGRDADLGFYLLDEEGNSTQPDRFVNMRRNGCGRVGETRFCFDAARNWSLLAALVEDPVARIQYVLVAPDIRRRVLAEGERVGAPAELLERVGIVTEPHSGSRSHRSHFHVRIYCPEDDRPRCADEPPFHAWYEGEAAPPSPAVRRMRVRQRRARARRARRRAARRARRDRARRARRAARRRSRAARAAE